jgi:hypothetical protein
VLAGPTLARALHEHPTPKTPSLKARRTAIIERHSRHPTPGPAPMGGSGRNGFPLPSRVDHRVGRKPSTHTRRAPPRLDSPLPISPGRRCPSRAPLAKTRSVESILRKKAIHRPSPPHRLFPQLCRLLCPGRDATAARRRDRNGGLGHQEARLNGQIHRVVERSQRSHGPPSQTVNPPVCSRSIRAVEHRPSLPIRSR